MKKINLKESVSLYRKQESALSHLQFVNSYYKDDAARVEQARNEYKDATSKFETEASRAISAALDTVQSRARERTVTAEKIVSMLAKIEDRLAISKKALDGVEVVVDVNAQNFPSAYKWTPMSTVFFATYKSGHWVLTDIVRERTRSESRKVVVYHTDASRAALVERFSAWG